MRYAVCVLIACFLCTGSHCDAQQTRLRNNLEYKIKSINDSLNVYAKGRRINLESDSVFRIELSDGGFFRVNVFTLLKEKRSEKDMSPGISFEPMRPRSKTLSSFIRFGLTERMGVLGFNSVDDAVVKRIYYQTVDAAHLMRLICWDVLRSVKQ